MPANTNLQVAFLSFVRNRKIPLTIYLANGIRLQGQITQYDNFCVLLERNGLPQLIFKWAISAILPSMPVNLQSDAGTTNGREKTT